MRFIFFYCVPTKSNRARSHFKHPLAITKLTEELHSNRFHQTWRAGTMKTEGRITKAATIFGRSALFSDIWIEWRGPRVYFSKARYRYQMVYSLFSKLAWGHFSLDASTLSFISLCHSGIDRLSCLDVGPQRVCSIATLSSTISLNHCFCELLTVSFVH